MNNPRAPRTAEPSEPTLTLIHGERPAPAQADPNLMEFGEIMYRAGRADERAAILGGIGTRRPLGRPVLPGPRPDLRVIRSAP